MITRLRLRNWKSHIDSEFEFTTGVNALVGIVGSGKSSVLQGITFALFGTLNPVKAKRISLDDLIMARPQEKGEAEVELECRIGEDSYSIKRVLKKGKGTSAVELRKNGELLDVAAKNATAELEKALQMDFELFSRAVYSEQNELDFFLRIPKGKRTEHIDRMLKVDRYEKVRGEAVSLMNRVASERKGMAELVQDMEKQGLEDKAQGMEKDISELKGRVGKLGRERESAEKERERMEEKVREMEDRQSELRDAESGLESVKAGLEEIEENLGRGRKKLEGIENLEERLLCLEKELAGLRKELDGKGKELEKSREMVAGFNTKVRLAQEGLDKIGELEDKCPVCESDITSEKRGSLVRHREEEIAELRKGIEQAAVSIGKLREEKERLEGEVLEKEKEKERLSGLSELEQEIREMEDKRKGYLERKGKLEKDLERLRKEFSKGEMEELRERHKERLVRENQLFTEIGGIEDLLGEKERSAKEIRERVRMLEEYRERIGVDEKVLEGLKGFVQALKATQDQLRQEFVSNVNQIMEQAWQELYPYGDFTGIRLAVDGDYTLELKGFSGWTSVDGVASGGERSLACLALRIAFSQAFIPNLSWLILDEPTHNLDTRAIQQLGEVLRERMGSFAEQIFLITHDERIAESVSTVYRLERDKGRNEPTRIAAG